MKTSYKGRAFIAREEGCVLSAYKDSVGVLTIGIGHTTAAGPPAVTAGLALSLGQCLALFETDLAKYEARVNAAVKVTISQTQFDALVSFDYNTGAINRASFIKKLNAGDTAGAGAGMMAYSKPKEIIGRRQREQRLFLAGDYGNITSIPVWEKKGGKVKAMTFPASSAPTPAPIPVPPPFVPSQPAPAPVQTPPPPKPSMVKSPTVITAAGGAVGTGALAAVGGINNLYALLAFALIALAFGYIIYRWLVKSGYL